MIEDEKEAFDEIEPIEEPLPEIDEEEDEDEIYEDIESELESIPDVDEVNAEEDQPISFYPEENEKFETVEQEVLDVQSIKHLPEDTVPIIPPTPPEGRIDVRPIEFPELEERISGKSFDLGFFANIPVKIDVFLGNTTITLKDVYDLTEGAIVSLDKLFGEPLDLRINGQVIARGDVVAVDNQYGVMIKEIIRSNT